MFDRAKDMAARVHLRFHGDPPLAFKWVRNHPENEQAIVTYLLNSGMSAWAEVLFMRAIEETGIKRADGGSDADDAALDLAERITEGFGLTASEQQATCKRLASLSFAEVQQKYWSDEDGGVFRGIYDKAVQAWGFKIPPEPAREEILDEQHDPSEWKNLKVADYHAMKTADVVRLYRGDAGFRRAVDRLVEKGQI